MSYDPDDETGYSAASWLGAYANMILNEYTEYWELDRKREGSTLSDEDREYFRSLSKVTGVVTDSLFTLTLSPKARDSVGGWLERLGIDKKAPEINQEMTGHIVKALSKHPIVRDGIQIDLAMHATDILLSDAETRVATLIALITTRNLSHRAAAYLDRATRLFLWGFPAESVVMCASVLEAAYEERFPPETMFQLQIPKKNKQYEPWEYERAALAAGVFSKAQKDEAASLRHARNDTLHNAPIVALTPEAALTTTATLLQCLFPTTTT